MGQSSWHLRPSFRCCEDCFPGYGDFGMVFGHQFDFLTIDSLEDVMGGHAFLAFAEILGGAHSFLHDWGTRT